ncbi:MAG: hypothetical protein RL497_2497 [Pseudomonadota bacterium]|jgi:HlyD family secretion protein
MSTAITAIAAIESRLNQDRMLQRPNRLGLLVLAVATGVGVVSLLAWLSQDWISQLKAQRSLPREHLRFAEVIRGDLRREFAIEGSLVVANSPTLYSSAEGIVTYHVKAGDPIKQGDLLLTIESPSLNSEFTQANAQLEQLKAQLTQIELTLQYNAVMDRQAQEKSQLELRASLRNFARFQQGFAEHFVSRLEYEKAEEALQLSQMSAAQLPSMQQINRDITQNQRKGLQQQVHSQEAVVKEFSRRMQALRMVSPVNGQVSSLILKQQAAVSALGALITVVDLSRFEVEADVAEHYARDIRPSMPVTLILDRQPHQGTIVAIAPEVSGGQINVRLGFSGMQPENLRQNQRVSAQILLEQKSQVLIIPAGLYLDADQGKSLFIVNGQMAQRTPVRIGARGISQVEVQHGLNEGDAIIISDTSALRDVDRLFINN